MATRLGFVLPPEEPLTLNQLKQMFPEKKRTLNQETVDIVNDAITDPSFDGFTLLDNLTTYKSVMEKNNGGFLKYVEALKFCAFLEGMKDNVTQAYIRTFGYREFVRERMNADTSSNEYKELTFAASRYRRSPMVVDILTMADIPLYLMFQSHRYEAVGVLAKMMKTAPLAKDRVAAADKLLTHVKPPDNLKIEMDIGVKENTALKDLEAQLAAMAKASLDKLEKGDTSLKELGAIKPREEVIDAEIDEDE